MTPLGAPVVPPEPMIMARRCGSSGQSASSPGGSTIQSASAGTSPSTRSMQTKVARAGHCSRIRATFSANDEW